MNHALVEIFLSHQFILQKAFRVLTRENSKEANYYERSRRKSQGRTLDSKLVIHRVRDLILFWRRVHFLNEFHGKSLVSSVKISSHGYNNIVFSLVAWSSLKLKTVNKTSKDSSLIPISWSRDKILCRSRKYASLIFSSSFSPAFLFLRFPSLVHSFWRSLFPSFSLSRFLSFYLSFSLPLFLSLSLSLSLFLSLFLSSFFSLLLFFSGSLHLHFFLIYSSRFLSDSDVVLDAIVNHVSKYES